MGMTLMSNPKGSVATVVVSEAGDGDTTDIQTGIDLLPATGGVVYIREGTYTITNAITITNDHTEIKGAGSSTIIQTVGNINAIFATNVDNISIHDVHIIGSGAGANNEGIHFTTVTGSIITGCFIDTMGANCILLDTTSDNNRIVNNNLSISRSGIWLDASSSNIISNNNINDMNYGAGPGYHGIALLNGSDSNTLIGNVIDDCRLSGLYSYDAERNTFTGNTSNNNRDGILIWGITSATSNNVVSSNVFWYNDLGANLDYVNQTIIANNNFFDNIWGIYGSAISRADDLTYITITGNEFIQHGGNAIRISCSNVNDSHDIIITGNVFYNNGYDPGGSTIWLSDPSPRDIYRVIISGNTINTSGLYGINIGTSRVHDTSIINNTFIANSSGHIKDSGTDTHVFNNVEN